MSHRQASIALLASACERHQPVRLDADGATLAHSLDGHFLGCDDRTVTVELASDAAPDAGAGPQFVRAHFGLNGRRYAFSSTVIGALAIPGAARARFGLRLRTPTVVCERSRRSSARIAAPLAPPTLVFFRPIAGGGLIEARLVDFSTEGLGCHVCGPLPEAFEPRAIFRAQIRTPEPAVAAEFLVRVVHGTPIASDFRLGLAFLGRDDSTEFDKRIRHLQDWMMDAQRRATSPQAAADDRGTRC